MPEPQVPPKIKGLEYLRTLGVGGQAQVLLYQQTMPRRSVAVKVLRETFSFSSARDQFLNEANVMARLEHPFIVALHWVGVAEDGRPYLVMQYYPNASLADRLVARGPLRVNEVLRLGIQIGSAVQTAHQAGVLHGDIKPHNILTNQYGSPGLTDFGVSSHLYNRGPAASFSLPWAAPEVLTGTGRSSVSSDVYSLAATMWHLLVGHAPFVRPSSVNDVGTMRSRILYEEVPAVSRRGVPSAFESLLRREMAKEPGRRSAAVLDFVRFLQAIEADLRLAPTEAVIDPGGGTVAGNALVHGNVPAVSGMSWHPPSEPAEAAAFRPAMDRRIGARVIAQGGGAAGPVSSLPPRILGPRASFQGRHEQAPGAGERPMPRHGGIPPWS